MLAFDIEADDLFDNPTARVPVSLCLDCSSSMSGAPINELNAGVASFYEAIQSDEIARYSAEIGIVTFGPAQKEADFQTVAVQPSPPVLNAHGMTPMGEAVKLSLDMLEERKEQYQASGVDYYQPWLVLMTDGRPEGGSAAVLAEQAARATKLVNEGRLTVFPIGIGKYADMATLQRFTPWTPLRLQGLKFTEFFAWLSASVAKVSQSIPGEVVPLDLAAVKGWSQIGL